MGRRRTGTAWEKPKTSGKWLAAITLADGSRHVEAVPPRPRGAPMTGEVARAFARGRQAQYDAGEWTPAPKGSAAVVASLTLGAWATTWAAASTRKGKALEEWVAKRMIADDPLGAVPLRSLATSDVVAYIERLKARDSRNGDQLAPRSVRQYSEIAHRATKAARAAGHLAVDPWEGLPSGLLPPARDKVPGARRGWRYSAAEVSQLIGDPRIPASWRALWAVAFGTGARGGELCAIRWEEWERDAAPLSRLVFARTISGRGGKLHEHETKTGAVKEAPVHPTLARILAWWWSEGWEAHVGRAPTPRDRVFPRPTGEHLYVARLWWALQRHCTAIGIRPRRLHGTRHTMVRLAREGGADRGATRAITHTAPASSDAFDGYDQPSWERLCEAVLKLDLRLPESDSAPDSATAVFVDPMNLDGIAPMDLLIKEHASRLPRLNAPGTADETARNATLAGDSAPDSAPVVALSGEALAYRWADLWLAADAGIDWQA